MVEGDAGRGDAPARVHLAPRAQHVPPRVILRDVEDVGLVAHLRQKKYGIFKVVLDTGNLDRRYRYKIQVLYLNNHKMYL